MSKLKPLSDEGRTFDAMQYAVSAFVLINELRLLHASTDDAEAAFAAMNRYHPKTVKWLKAMLEGIDD